MTSAIPVSVRVSVFRGTEYIELTAGTDHVTVLTDGHLFADSFEHGDSPKGPWVTIKKSDLDRRFRRLVTATCDGQEVQVTGRGDGVAHIACIGPGHWAVDHGLEGSQYEGWRGSVPVDRLSDVTVTVTVTEKDIR